MTPLSPPDTAYFTCTQVALLPTARVHRGCVIKLFPTTYFGAWSKKENDPGDRLDISAQVSRLVLPTLDLIEVTHVPVRRSVYCWRSRTDVPVTWGDVYRSFPRHGVKPDDHQVAPWQHLQELVFGWNSVPAIIPRNDRGALLMLGDAGLQKPTPTGKTIRGTDKFLVQLSFFTPLSSPTWALGLPNKETSDQLLPADMTIITIQ